MCSKSNQLFVDVVYSAVKSSGRDAAVSFVITLSEKSWDSWTEAGFPDCQLSVWMWQGHIFGGWGRRGASPALWMSISVDLLIKLKIHNFTSNPVLSVSLLSVPLNQQGYFTPGRRFSCHCLLPLSGFGVDASHLFFSVRRKDFAWKHWIGGTHLLHFAVENGKWLLWVGEWAVLSVPGRCVCVCVCVFLRM